MAAIYPSIVVVRLRGREYTGCVFLFFGNGNFRLTHSLNSERCRCFVRCCRLPKLSLKISSKKRKKKGSESDSGDDVQRDKVPPPEEEDDSNKRRSGRNTNRRKKYVENDLDLDDEEFLMPVRKMFIFIFFFPFYSKISNSCWDIFLVSRTDLCLV